MSSTSRARRPMRIKIPFLLDLITVKDPGQIKQIEASGDVDRLHVNGTSALPWWVPLYFRATRFYDEERDLWFCPLESSSDPSYLPRRHYLEEKLSTGHSQEDVAQIADLLRQGADDETVGYQMTHIIVERFFGHDVPHPISDMSQHTVQTFGEALRPWQYMRGRKAQHQVVNYCDHHLNAGVHRVDVSQNIGGVMHATVPALRRLQESGTLPVEAIFTQHAPTPQILRIAVRRSTLGGLVSSPIKPSKTVLIYRIGEAAAATGDIRFTFGAGTDERLCVFNNFFLDFMTDLQRELTTRGS